ncbi:MAG: hypothetical protein SWK90_02860 [Chloroflexota bacterium]|nr:hypothetical protein [Chloroflexota bacterium]
MKNQPVLRTGYTHFIFLILAAVLFLGGCGTVPTTMTSSAITALPTDANVPAAAIPSATAPSAATDVSATTAATPFATASPVPTDASVISPEQPVRVVPVTGALVDKDAEVSGLAWYGDYLIILPQYPDRFASPNEGLLFAIPKGDILAFLDGTSDAPIMPQDVLFVAPGLARQIAGFEGYEAIAFQDDRVFVTIESKTGMSMLGYLVAGEMAPDLSSLCLDATTLTEIPPQAGLINMTDETLLVAGDRLVTVYEANGAAVNSEPVARLFALSLYPLDPIPFPNVEYRITDATGLDGADRFWALNYFWPGDETKLKPATDALATKYGKGPTHARLTTVERLVEFQYTETGISLVDTPPIQLELIDDDHSRNWEGIVRLDNRGFLLVTDTYPETILGFVSVP